MSRCFMCSPAAVHAMSGVLGEAVTSVCWDSIFQQTICVYCSMLRPVLEAER